MPNYDLFVVLDATESTNNYAMGQIHEGLATHGQAWFAQEQWGGKGQRGKKWESEKGKNIILSVVLKPHKALHDNPFLLSMFTANICRQFFSKLASKNVSIKWPNDIYIDDRKAGGILIENKFRGKDWLWAVIGIGININQIVFEAENSISLKMITGEVYDSVLLAKQLYATLLHEFNELNQEKILYLVDTFNAQLYKREELVNLKKDNAIFKTKIIGVNEKGQLLTNDTLERKWEVGEIEWIIE
jgi:BirA family transcriptional regulator, biotin operon repressor / biotin---[acetyl-CoA-carboxylase] ligase